MRTASYRVSDLQKFTVPLGFVGENEHCQIIFLAEDVYQEYPHAAASLTVRPPYGEPYPAVVTRDGNNVVWTVKDSDLTRSGQGELQLSFTTGEIVAKTYVGKTKICRSIQPTGDVPDPLEDFLTEAGAALTAIPETIAHEFEAIQAVAQTLEPGSQATAHFDGETKQLEIGVPEGEKGDPGYTPRRGVDYWTEADQAAMRQDIADDTTAARQAIAQDKAAAELAITQDKNAAQQAISEDRAAAITVIGNKGTEQVDAVTNKGAEVLASIPSDYTELSEDVSGLKSALNSKVDLAGIAQVTPENLQIMDVVFSPNLIDETKITDGEYIQKNGTVVTGSYQVTDYIPVEAGEKYCATWTMSGSRSNIYLRFLCCYDTDKNVVASAGSDTAISTYPITIASGVAFVRLSFSNNHSYSKFQFEKAETPTDYAPYGVVSAVVKDDYLPVTSVEFEALESEVGGKVDKSGSDQVVPRNLSIMEKTYSPNLIDETKLTSGGYITKNGIITESTSYQYTDYIPVDAGGKYCFSWMLNNSYRQDGGIRFLACYNSSKEVISSAGSDSNISTYPMTIAEGVSFVRLSFSSASNYTKFQFEKGEERGEYHVYGEILSAVVKEQYLPDDPIDMADIPAFELVRGQNLLNPNDPNYQTGKFLYTNGNVDDHASYTTSGYIAVSEGDNLLASYVNQGGGAGKVGFRTIACYDASKAIQSTKGVYSVDRFAVPSGVAFVRICYQSSTYGSDVQVIIVDEGQSYFPYKAYENPHYETKEAYLPKYPEKPIHVYLPAEIYVAVGRTIELYNEQVVLDYEKYHFQWKCSKGAAYKRKFSITGSTTGNYTLYLTLYDDKQRIVWSGESTIHVVSASNPEVKILPIGDSLTRGKAWLPETMLLSSSNVEWLGTRYTNNLKDSENNTYTTIHHEGRSGWSAGNYLADTVYDQDTNYDGVAGVDGSANPFWDGTKFSLEHYLTTQTGIDTPDAVQIFLGTNDLTTGVETATENIMTIVESIRGEYADLPIFLCNTIYRSNQNGYGSTGTEAYAGGGGANAWQYEQDSRVMDLMENLRHELATYTGVYMIPLASCMDREYSFGQVMTKVNPRSTVEVPMPSESVHPQNVGYFQMADLMYSFYCGVLGS